jgi:hypothetical protein
LPTGGRYQGVGDGEHWNPWWADSYRNISGAEIRYDDDGNMITKEEDGVILPSRTDFHNAYYTALKDATPSDIEEAAMIVYEEVQERKKKAQADAATCHDDGEVGMDLVERLEP